MVRPTKVLQFPNICGFVWKSKRSSKNRQNKRVDRIRYVFSMTPLRLQISIHQTELTHLIVLSYELRKINCIKSCGDHLRQNPNPKSDIKSIQHYFGCTNQSSLSLFYSSIQMHPSSVAIYCLFIGHNIKIPLM